ncbi:hypothetical protein NC651_014715 [Populus alba x Populus x berolinensis]|nr:hypothetical protein NC651_014715 [Populus alba x Populus x berolinensis]
MAMAYRPQVKDGGLFVGLNPKCESREQANNLVYQLVQSWLCISLVEEWASCWFPSAKRTCWIYAVICFMFAQSQRTDSKTEHLYRQRYSSFCAANNRAKHYTGKWILKSTTSWWYAVVGHQDMYVMGEMRIDAVCSTQPLLGVQPIHLLDLDGDRR